MAGATNAAFVGDGSAIESGGVFGGVSVELLDMHFVSYARRWFMLAVVALLNFSSFSMWFTFSSVANFVDEFYCVNDGCLAANWLVLTFFMMNLPAGLVAILAGDIFGLRSVIITGAWLNFLGALIRVLSSMTFMPLAARFPVAIAGQAVCAAANPFIAYLPAKLSALWFPENQRAFATSVPTKALIAGSAAGLLIAPIVVTSVSQLWLWLVILMAAAALVTAMATLGVCSSVPPTPPSASAAQNNLPFLKGLLTALSTWPYVISLLFFGAMGGAYNTLLGLLQQILCPNGYSNLFAGLCGALATASGVVGGAIASPLADRTKKHVWILKAYHTILALVTVVFVFLLQRANMEVPLAIGCCLLGALVPGSVSLVMELAAESTYPVAQMTTTGFVWMFMHIGGICFMFLLPALTTPTSAALRPNQTCAVQTDSTVQIYDWNVAVIVFGAVIVGSAAVCVLFFWPTLKRTANEASIKKLSAALTESRRQSQDATVAHLNGLVSTTRRSPSSSAETERM